MIVKPKTQVEWQACMQFLNQHAFVQPTADMEFAAWVVQDQLEMVVGFNAYLGETCQMHVAMAPGFEFTPKEMLKHCFDHVFNQRKRSLILGIVNSRNEKAMRYDEHLGFKELWRLPKMHEDGGDIVVLGLHKKDCKFLNFPVKVAA